LKHAIEKADENLGRSGIDGAMQWGGFDVDVFYWVVALAEAQGLWFDCPKCKQAAPDGKTGVHGIQIFFDGRGVPDRLGKNKAGETVRWNVSGHDYSDLSMTPSILLQAGCEWHGHITNGEIR
jgi:hypothetical protein